MLLVDGAKGIEAQTRKLFAVARLRQLPVFTFVSRLPPAGAAACCELAPVGLREGGRPPCRQQAGRHNMP